MPKFKCNEFFLDQKVEAIYAGSRSAFAFSDLTGNSMTEFIREFNEVNEEGKEVRLPKGLIEIQTADGGSFLVSKVTWECYFPVDSRDIKLTKTAAILLFKLLNCELSDKKITEWVKEQARIMFNNDLNLFESTLKSMVVWLEIASMEGLDPEAAEFIKSYFAMLAARITNLYVADESNSELYRVMHVNKNVI